MNKQIIIVLALFALVGCVLAQYGQYQQYEQKEKRFLNLPALKIKLGLDQIPIGLPSLGPLFTTQQERHYPQY